MENKKTIGIHSKDIGNGRFEVCGVIFTARNHTDAIRKYLRKKKPSEKVGCELEEHF